MKPTLLITWWLGYIGSHAVVCFEQAGYRTIIIDNESNSERFILERLASILWYIPVFYPWDIRDKDLLREIFQRENISWVIHFAGLKSVSESCTQPLTYFDNNLVWSLTLFAVMQEFQVRSIIFSSSATVYNGAWFNWDDFVGIVETAPVWDTINPYGTSKYLVEKILEDLAQFAGFRVMNLRYFNPIWAHESGLIGEKPNGIPNNLLPYILKVASWELSELTVYGDDYPTPDGTGVRDYIDVNDLIDGHLQAYKILESLSQWGSFETYNLGRWVWVSVLELLDVARNITGQTIPHRVWERRAWDLACVYCNPHKAESQLNWKALRTPQESISAAWKFYNR